jgi:hypothetical protein
MQAALYRAVGMDPSCIGQLGGKHPSRFLAFAVVALAGTGLQVGSVAYGLSLVFSPPVAAGGGLLLGGLLLSLLRLQLAGGGIAPHRLSGTTEGDRDLVARWRPSLWPALISLLLAALLLQPLLVVLVPETVDAGLTAERSAAVQRDAWVLASAKVAGTQPIAGAEGRRVLTAESGLATSCRAVWSRPLRAGAWTLLLSCLASLPLLVRVLLPRAIRDYEGRRSRAARSLIVHNHQSVQGLIGHELEQWAPGDGSVTQRTPFADPPFNTRWLGRGSVEEGEFAREWVEGLPEMADKSVGNG